MINKEKYKKLLEAELSSIKTLAVWPNLDGSYTALEHYRLIPKAKQVEVEKNLDQVAIFTTMRNALAWAIADANARHDVAVELKYLNNKIATLKADIETRSKLAKSISKETRELVSYKITPKLKLLQDLEARLDQLVEKVKHWQQRGFNNEIKRSSSIAC